METIKKITSVFIIAFVSAALAIILNNKFGDVSNNQLLAHEKTPVHLTNNVSNGGLQTQLPDLDRSGREKCSRGGSYRRKNA